MKDIYIFFLTFFFVILFNTAIFMNVANTSGR